MHTWLATAPFGLEGLVAQELRDLGFQDVQAGLGGAHFTGASPEAFRANLWLRCADRVQLVVGRFPAHTFDQLFEGVRALPWETFIPADAAFPVSGNCARSTLMSVRDCQAITKKAIVERLKQKHRRATLPESAETYNIQVSLHKDIATLTLDTSGQGLSRRGYRTWNGEAPLRETLAASLVLLSPWRPDRPLHDPLCGTGTLLIEAAFIACGRAPGLERGFACERWRWMPQHEMQQLRSAARDAIHWQDMPDIAGSDLDPSALELAARHLRQAGLNGKIPLRVADVQSLALPDRRGIVLTNPPYGERLSDREGCDRIARALRRIQDASGWTICPFTAYHGFERAFGRRADKRRRLYNARLECEFMTFYPQRKR